MAEENENEVVDNPPASVEQEIEQFAGTTRFPDFKGEEKTELPPTQKVEGEELGKIPDLEDFAKILGQTPKEKTTAKIETKKVEAKVETKEEDSEQEAPIPPKTNNQPKTPARDYTGFGEVEAKYLQKMSNESFDYFSKHLKESRVKEETYKNEKKSLETELAKAKEGKVQLPESYYDNPNAAILMPEVQTLQANVSLASQIQNHWKNQLIAVKSGKPIYDLVQDAKGNITVAAEATEITEENKAQIEMTLQEEYQNAIMQTGKFRQQLDTTVSGFKTKHLEKVAAIRSFEDKVMPIFSEENKDTDEYKTYLSVAEGIAKQGISKDNPVFNMLAKSCALNFILRDLYNSEVKKTKVVAAVKQDQKKAGPTGSSFTGGGNGSGLKEAPSLESYEAYGLPKIRN
jgi:hypothetical protein